MASDRPAEALAALLGPDLAGQAIKAGWDALRPLIAKRPDMVPPGVADYVAATVLLGAAPVVAAEIDRLRKENDLLAPANDAYWAAQKVLDEALGTEAEHGSGQGLAADVRLLMVQRDKAEARGYARAVEVLRDDERFLAWYRDNVERLDDEEAEYGRERTYAGIAADYLEVVAPEGGAGDGD